MDTRQTNTLSFLSLPLHLRRSEREQYLASSTRVSNSILLVLGEEGSHDSEDVVNLEPKRPGEEKEESTLSPSMHVNSSAHMRCIFTTAHYESLRPSIHCQL